MYYLKNINGFNSEVNEKLNISRYRNIFQKTIKELNLNFYFISTFGTTIPVFYPIFEKLVKNNNLELKLTTTDIVLLTICAIGVLFNENKQEITKIKNILTEKGFSELIDKAVEFVKSINNIFSAISKNTGKILITITDMFSYTALYVPFLIALLDMINLYELGFDNFKADMTTLGFSLSFGIGVVTISLKHFLNMLIKKISRLTKKKIIKENLNVEFIYSELV